MSIELLPDNLLLEIFTNINQYEIIWTLKLVCQRWKQLVEEFGLPNKVIRLTRFPKLWGDFGRCKRRINKALEHFPSLQRLEFDNFFKPVSILDRSYPHITEVSFTLSNVHPEDILPLVRCLPNLKSFGAYWEFNLNDQSLGEVIKEIPFLEKFELDAAYRFDLRGRFMENFRQIKSLYIDLGQPLAQELILHIVNTSGDSLISLSLKPVEFRHIRIIGTKFKSLEQLRIMRLQRFAHPSHENYDFSGLKNLTKLHIDAWETIQPSMLREFLEAVLKSIKDLKDLKMSCHPLNGVYVVSLIAKNCPNLQQLTLLNPEFGDEVCPLFASFPKLRQLMLTGGKHKLTDDGITVILSSCPELRRKCFRYDLGRHIII